MNLKNFDEINLEQLQKINGGSQEDYKFGHKVGNTIRWIGKELWYNTIGARPVY
ncbi:bacteriocin-type signal sequence [Clostridium tarantellae]|uniref:Bacteriocin-type signal sequence n=1 Tax=Clostridium tarantellae TaxID=39493 RepID=A0A6I1MKX5_9CLOT|nr:bacteriocin-type signal sequence [Clostridium tarantellae]MPQ43624.1 bacteriocin-type signal sequence [Clostridium tarantellae]